MNKFAMVLMALLLGAAPATQGAEKAAAPKGKESVMQGAWKITTVGVTGAFGRSPAPLSQTILLTFNEKPVKGKAIEGKPFGFEIVSSRLSEAKPAGNVSFVTTYKMMNPVPINWHGKLSEDGTKITEGKFSFMLGSGTFTAEKQDGPKEKK